MGVIKDLARWVRDYDSIVTPSTENLHFQTDYKQKTLVGGVASLGVTIYVAFVVYTKGSQMIGLEDPYISSLEQNMDYELVGKVALDTVAKPLIEILEYEDTTVDLEEEDYRQYIHLRLRNIIKSYPDDVYNVESKYFPIEKCTADDFVDSEF